MMINLNMYENDISSSVQGIQYLSIQVSINNQSSDDPSALFVLQQDYLISMYQNSSKISSLRIYRKTNQVQHISRTYPKLSNQRLAGSEFQLNYISISTQTNFPIEHKISQIKLPQIKQVKSISQLSKQEQQIPLEYIQKLMDDYSTRFPQFTKQQKTNNLNQLLMNCKSIINQHIKKEKYKQCLIERLNNDKIYLQDKNQRFKNEYDQGKKPCNSKFNRQIRSYKQNLKFFQEDLKLFKKTIDHNNQGDTHKDKVHLLQNSMIFYDEFILMQEQYDNSSNYYNRQAYNYENIVMLPNR